jgi:hypothetical protein
MVDAASPQLVRAARRVIADQVARGEDPTGKAWKLTKKGARPLVRAAEAVTVRMSGKILTMSIFDHHARHHIGSARGKVRRRILPSSKLPDPYAQAIRRVLVVNFNRTMGVR